MSNNRPSMEERHRLQLETAHAVNERTRIKRALEIVLTELGMMPVQVQEVIEEVRTCDFRQLGTFLQEKGFTGGGVRWCANTEPSTGFNTKRQLDLARSKR